MPLPHQARRHYQRDPQQHTVASKLKCRNIGVVLSSCPLSDLDHLSCVSRKRFGSNFFKYTVILNNYMEQNTCINLGCINCTNLMLCWPWILVYQYRKTNVMHFLFNLLRIKGLYMFRALLAHPQEALHKRHLVLFNVHTVHIRRIRRKNQQYALIVPLLYFYVLASTCFGSSLPSSGSLLDPPELLENTNWRLVYHITCGYVACVPDCRGSVCCVSQLSAYALSWITRMQYTKCRLWSASWGWASNARNM
jgi:hypothetical protein